MTASTGSGLSPAPGTPQTGAKAVVGAVGTVVLAALVTLVGFVTGQEGLGSVTASEWLWVVISALVAGGINGGAIYQTLNKPKV